jgi:site-specific DNA-methyltransferase (adenine-specific)
LNITQKTLDELIPYENNPRDNDDAVDYVAESIKEFGFKVPIIIDKNNVIVAGHTRYKACKKLGINEVPCLVADDLTEEQIKAFRLADNKVAEIATWDFEKLDLELSTLELDMELFGFEIIEDEEPVEATEDDYEVEVPEEPKAKYGDVYQLGKHRLMCGDSTSIDDVEKLMNGAKVDLLITDPPYNVNYEGATKDKLTIMNDKMDNDNFRQFLLDAFTCADNVMKDGAAFYIWHADSEGYNFRGACYDVGWTVRQCLIWNKNSLVLGRQDYHWKHEPCLYGWKDGASHNWYGDRKQTTVLDFDRPSRNAEHPTMKPIPLFDYQIQNNTKKGDIVLDLFGGSGTTLMASEQNERSAYLMELDPKYVDVIINRWEQFTGQKAVLVSEHNEDIKTA